MCTEAKKPEDKAKDFETAMGMLYAVMLFADENNVPYQNMQQAVTAKFQGLHGKPTTAIGVSTVVKTRCGDCGSTYLVK